MAQVEWPTRHVLCNTFSLGDDTHFKVNPADENCIILREEVTMVSGGSRTTGRYIQLAANEATHEYSLSSDSAGKSIVTVPGSFILELNVGILVNYPTRPMLVDPGAVSNTSHTNPLEVHGYTQGFPRFEGSATLDVRWHGDVGIVEAFFDQLYDPEAWFELPLPGLHLGAQDVQSYDGTNNEITIRTGSLADTNMHGAFARVGARTAKVIYHRRPDVSSNDHIIKIAPSSLVTGSGDNIFSNQATVRVRATNISSSGNADYGATWNFDWVETNRTD